MRVRISKFRRYAILCLLCIFLYSCVRTDMAHTGVDTNASDLQRSSAAQQNSGSQQSPDNPQPTETQSGSAPLTSSAAPAASYVPNTALYPEEDLYTGWNPGYSFIYTEGSRERIWEEDVVSFANTLLSPYGGHIYLDDREFAITTNELTKNIDPQLMNKFDPVKQKKFVSFINHILREIAVRDDEDITYMISESLTGIGDVHTYIRFPYVEESYPFVFEILEDAEGRPGVYCTSTIKDYEGALGKKLISINGLPMDELIRRLERLEAFENPYLHERGLFERERLNYGKLKYLGIVESEEALFEFEGGHAFRVAPIAAADYSTDEYRKKRVRMWHWMERLSYERADALAYWYRVIDEDQIIYARLTKFLPFPEYEVFQDGLFLSDYDYAVWDAEHLNMYEFLGELTQQCKEKGEDYKLIIDLRGNPGGYPFPDLKSLRLFREVGNPIYIFTDEGSASCSCFATFGIKAFVPNTTIVGSPTAQPVNFPLGKAPVITFRIVEPNTYRYSNGFTYLDGNNTDDAIFPDVLLYQKYDDFVNHIDTLYEWVKNHR